MLEQLVRLVAALCLVAAGSAAAQDYPNKPIIMVVPFAAGGPTDTVARKVAAVMAKSLKQQVLRDNAVGAGGTLGAGRAAQAAPDGYTLLMHHIGMSTAPTLYRKLAFNPLEAFDYVGLVTEVPMVLVARPDFEPKDLKSLIDYVKANKDKVNYANAGIGAASHLCGLMFMTAIDTKLTTVPYKGTGPALTDLMGGQVDFMCDQTTNTTNQIKEGKIKAYATTTPKRLDALPDVPTAEEAGLSGFQVSIWHGIYAPKGTPKEAIDKLSAALQKALKDPNVVERFASLGTSPVAEDQATPAALEAKLKSEIARWKPVIEAAGQYAD
jgi:tripartite-type tricarboxylate transporter receptor subunit TctC